MGVSFGLAKSAKSILIRSALLPAVMSLGACASFQGQPDPVLGNSVASGMNGVVMSSAFGLFRDHVSAAYNSPDSEDRCIAIGTRMTCGLSQEQYRNYVIGAYLATANDRYGSFTRRLRIQSRGSTFALDVAGLAASSGASIASEGTANVLGAIGSFLSGTRSNISRELYFDRTVPALIGAMEAERTRLSAIILTGLRKPVGEYPLESALNDVQAYEQAGSLDTAIQSLTTAAGEEVEEAREFAEDVSSYTRPAEEGVDDVRVRTRARLFQLAQAGNRDALLRIANAAGLSVAADITTDDLRRALQRKLNELRTLEEAQGFAQEVDKE